MVRILVATEREAEALGIPCEVIGIGGSRLPETSPDDILVHVGYCGGYQVSVGKVIEPGFVGEYETDDTRDLNIHFPCATYPCFTSEGFVTEPKFEGACVYDMELWKIARLPHKKLYCLKIVSNNLDEKECEAFDDQEAWKRVRDLLEGEKLI